MRTEVRNNLGTPSYAQDKLQAAGSNLLSRLPFGTEITMQEWLRLGRPPVCIISNSLLNPERFRLRPQDCAPLHPPYASRQHHPRVKAEPFQIAGKSCVVDTAGLASGSSIARHEKAALTSLVFGEKAGREDNIYSAVLGELLEAGFHVFYVPVVHNWLHARLVWENHIDPIPGRTPLHPSEKIVKNLHSKWKKVKVR